MTTVTTEHASSHDTGGHSLEASHDPLKDIDAKNTTIVLILSTLFVFVSVWLLYYLFAWIMHDQHVEKVERAPTIQRNALSDYEAAALSGGAKQTLKLQGLDIEIPARKSIEDAMREIATK